MKKYGNKANLHTVYKKKDGSIVPGGSTIAKGADSGVGGLLNWVKNLTLQGIDFEKARDESGEIGTLAHYLIMCDLTKQEPSFNEWSPEIVHKAHQCLLSYRAWKKTQKFKVVFCEKEFVSEGIKCNNCEGKGEFVDVENREITPCPDCNGSGSIGGFGGTIDLLAETKEGLALMDFKTGGLYKSAYVQVAGYRLLLKEHNYDIKKSRLINIPKGNTDFFIDQPIEKIEVYEKIFLNLLDNWYLDKEIKK